MTQIFQIERKPLAKALTEAAKAAKRKAEKKEEKGLCNILVTANKDTLTLTGCNGTAAIEIDLPLIGNGTTDPYSFIVDKKTFTNIIKNFNVEFVNVEVQQGENYVDLTVSNDLDTIHTSALLADNYLNIFRRGKEETLLTLDYETLQTIKKEVAHCASKQDFREALMGIHFTSSDVCKAKNQTRKTKAKAKKQETGYFIAEATDGFKLARKEFKEIPATNLDVTLNNSLLAFCNIFDKDKPIQVKSNGWTVILECGNKRLISKTPDSPYPNLDKVLPKTYSMTFTLDAQELVNKLNFGVQMLKGKEASVCVLVYDAKKENITLNTFLKDEFNSEMTLTNFIKKGATEDLRIGFNANYMMDILKANDPDFKVELGFISNKKPISIQTPENKDLTSIIVPLRMH